MKKENNYIITTINTSTISRLCYRACVYTFFKHGWYYISRWWYCNVIKL